MPAEQRNRFIISHPHRGNLLWHADGRPVSFAEREKAQAALEGFVRGSRGDEFAAGFTVELTPAEQHAADRCQPLRHGC